MLARSFPTTSACRQWFYRAVKRLAEYGAIEITRKLEKNIKRHVYVEVELKGQILVHEDLRAPLHHDRTVRDIKEGSPTGRGPAQLHSAHGRHGHR